MKNSTPQQLLFNRKDNKRFAFHASMKKKNTIIKNIEIIVACIVAFIAGTGMYELFK
ncbi:hypothetical protein [Flavobacterium cyanobacteriorum]|uniref:hypothetical protein n=1 Tax=Flavobacterium cyanobacteriorum TaxID=2022802 RepID=UPI0013FE2CB6|nr:hypothetical protein [Flavobacterium cyanobacteriorum]